MFDKLARDLTGLIDDKVRRATDLISLPSSDQDDLYDKQDKAHAPEELRRLIQMKQAVNEGTITLDDIRELLK